MSIGRSSELHTELSLELTEHVDLRNIAAMKLYSKIGSLAAMLVITWIIPGTATAQYKNQSFGLDAGFGLITTPSVANIAGDGVASPGERPLRMGQSLRLGGESSFKMNSDHWWFSSRLNLAMLTFGPDGSGSLDDTFDQAAKDSIGNLFGVEAGIGVRYVFATDKIRPYIQVASSYLRLFTFSSAAEDPCTNLTACGEGVDSTHLSNFLPHANVGKLHLQPGIEIIVERDIALHIFADIEHWFLWNAPDNQSVVIGLGFNFFT